MLKNFPRLLHWLSVVLLIGAIVQQPAVAQFRIEVSGVGFSQIPIAFAQFRDEDSSPQKISTIVRNDLERSGQYKPLGFNDVVDESQRPDPSILKQIGADAFVAGSVFRFFK